MTKVTVTQIRSEITQTRRHRGTLRSLGLRRIGQSKEHTMCPELEGKLRQVAHLVRVEGGTT